MLTLQLMHVDDIFYKAKYASMFQIIIYTYFMGIRYTYLHKRSDQ